MKLNRTRVWLILLAVVSTVVFLSMAWIRSGSAGPNRPITDRSLAEMTADDQGTTFVLIEGTLYRVDQRRGQLVYIDHLYDKDFFAKNYTLQDGQAFRKDDAAQLYPTRRQLAEGFEDAATLVDLVAAKPEDVLSGKRVWTNFTLQSPRSPTVKAYNSLAQQILREGGEFLDNRVEPSEEVVHSGKRSLKCTCVAKSSSMITTKASLSSSLLYFTQGDDFWFSAWFYVAGEVRPHTLIDLESTWIKQHPGMRIVLREDGRLAAELKWAHKPMYRQPQGQQVTFPVSRWVAVKLHLRLSANADGMVELWQDGKQLIAETGQTLPLANTVYDNLEVGISAHSFGSDPTTLFVDDIVVADGHMGLEKIAQ